MGYCSGKEMLDAIRGGTDLYCEELELYVFLYNEAGSICYYYISPEEAKDLQKQSEKWDEYWGAFLGVGGHIVDDPSYEEYDEDQLSNLEWCEQMFDHKWIPTWMVQKGE